MSSVLYVVILFLPDISFLFMMNWFGIFLNLLLVTNLSWHIVTKAIPSLQKTR